MIKVHDDFKELYNVCSERFYYDETSGTIRRKYDCKSNHYKAGDIVGYKRKQKRTNSEDDVFYLFTKIDGVSYSIQQIVFLLTEGYIPNCIDHINRDTLDNHRENLRDASRSGNARNKCKVYKNGFASSDYIGVSKRGSGFRCRIRIDHVIAYDETFENETSAAYAYNVECIKLGVSEYTNFNKFEDEESVRKLYEKEKENKEFQEYWKGTHKQGKRWGAKVKSVRLGTFETREEARLAIIRYKEGF